MKTITIERKWVGKLINIIEYKWNITTIKLHNKPANEQLLDKQLRSMSFTMDLWPSWIIISSLVDSFIGKYLSQRLISSKYTRKLQTWTNRKHDTWTRPVTTLYSNKHWNIDDGISANKIMNQFWLKSIKEICFILNPINTNITFEFASLTIFFLNFSIQALFCSKWKTFCSNINDVFKIISSYRIKIMWTEMFVNAC